MRKIRTFFNHYRIRTGLILLVAVTLYANLNLLLTRVQLYRELPGTDPISFHEGRIEPLRKALPPLAAVGYVTTVENDLLFLNERSFRDVEFLAQYYLTQYTLAPVLVYNSPDQAWVVGNFLSGPADPERIRKLGLTLRRDFGDGLILYQKEGKP